MDFLLSIPVLSAFATPSWHTSINLLFFYATWSTLVLTHSAPVVHSVALLALRLALWLVPSALFLALDTLLPSLADSIKLPSAECPPRQPLQRLGLAVVNMLLVTAVEALVSFGFARFSSPIFRTTTTLPLPWSIFKHLVLLFVARESLTYYIHRHLLHGDRRRTLTRLHVRYAHAYPPSPVQLYADHPVPLLILHLLPVLVPSLLIRPHLLTYILFTALCTIEGTFVTSGYSIVPGIILGGITRRTAAHYASRGSANYGAWGALDWAHGTSRGGDVVTDLKDEADKHNLKDRSTAKLNGGADAIQDGIDALSNGSGARRRSGRKRTPKADK